MDSKATDTIDLRVALARDTFVFRAGDRNDEVEGCEGGVDNFALEGLALEAADLDVIEGGLFGLLSD